MDIIPGWWVCPHTLKTSCAEWKTDFSPCDFLSHIEDDSSLLWLGTWVGPQTYYLVDKLSKSNKTQMEVADAAWSYVKTSFGIIFWCQQWEVDPRPKRSREPFPQPLGQGTSCGLPLFFDFVRRLPRVAFCALNLVFLLPNTQNTTQVPEGYDHILWLYE